MPVIRYIPQGPTDLVLQGEHMRAVAMGLPTYIAPAPLTMFPLLEGGIEPCLLCTPELIAGEQSYAPMVGAYPIPPRAVLRYLRIAAHGYIATPCGALYPMQTGQHIMDVFIESTVRWVFAGTTYLNSESTPLAGCRVVVFDVGRFVQSQAPLIAEAISDGSGNFSIEVPSNGTYEAWAYLPGSPDVGGITISRVDIVPLA